MKSLKGLKLTKIQKNFDLFDFILIGFTIIGFITVELQVFGKKEMEKNYVNRTSNQYKQRKP